MVRDKVSMNRDGVSAICDSPMGTVKPSRAYSNELMAELDHIYELSRELESAMRSMVGSNCPTMETEAKEHEPNNYFEEVIRSARRIRGVLNSTLEDLSNF